MAHAPGCVVLAAMARAAPAAPVTTQPGGGAKRFGARMNGWMPSMIQAGDYAANWHCLKAMAKIGWDKAKASGRATVEQMKAMPTDDPLFGKGSVRADGRVLHPMYLFQVKAPAESHYAWDYYKLLRRIDAADAFRPLAAGQCPLVHA